MAQPNWANRTLFHGDNLDFLRELNSESVHLIATDPPFNKGRDFHATPDSLASGASFQDRWSWKNDVHQEWIDQLEDDWPSVWSVIQGSRNGWGDDMGTFLCFMAVRMLEMHRILRDDGAIYLHCDTTASHYLKMLMDAIFGNINFRNDIIWERSAGRSDAKSFARVHDNILYYVKSDAAVWNQQYEPLSQDYIDSMYRYEDRHGRYTTMPLAGSGVSGKTHTFTWRGIYTKNWRFTTESLERLEADGLIHWSKNGRPRRKFYLSESKGVAARDVITNISRATPKERTGYPTQKPLILYERIIKASSNPGNIVLDPFCGCATTCVAAEKLNRQWVGIDIWNMAHEVTVDRLKKEGCLAGPDDDRPDLLITEGSITYSTEPPRRTDDTEQAAPYLKTVKRVNREPPGPKLSRAEMIERLQDENGLVCAGCDREFDDPRYLQLDHNTPRADGGLNHISNRILLCGPCNQLKSHTLTLSGLRRENKKRNFMQSTSTEKSRTKSRSRQRHLSSYR